MTIYIFFALLSKALYLLFLGCMLPAGVGHFVGLPLGSLMSKRESFFSRHTKGYRLTLNIIMSLSLLALYPIMESMYVQIPSDGFTEFLSPACCIPFFMSLTISVLGGIMGILALNEESWAIKGFVWF